MNYDRNMGMIISILSPLFRCINWSLNNLLPHDLKYITHNANG